MSRASVTVRERIVGSISQGLLVLVGFTDEDAEPQLDWMARKLLALRVFGDDDGKMNLSLVDIGGEILVVSQFTLYGDATRGNRPSFIKAADPGSAVPLYESFVQRLSSTGLKVETGEFGAMMEVELVNDGPVTILLER